MDNSNQEGGGKKKTNEITTFPVLFPLGENQENITINTPSKGSKQLFPFP